MRWMMLALEAVLAPADAVVNMVGILAESGAQKFVALQAELPRRIGQMAARHHHQAVVHLSAIGADASISQPICPDQSGWRGWAESGVSKGGYSASVCYFWPT